MGLIITWTANKKNTVWEGFTNLKQTTKPHVDFSLSRGNISFPKNLCISQKIGALKIQMCY